MQFAEARINRELRVSGQITTVTGAVGAPGYASQIVLPDDYRAMHSLRLAVGNTYLEVHPLPAEYLSETIATGYPRGYVEANGVLTIIGGTGTEDYSMSYYAKVPALSDTNTTTWLLTNEPALYLYAALIEAAPYLRGRQDDLMVWSQQFRSIMDGLKSQDDSARFGNAPAMVIHAP